jgi:hypothetical protein
MGYAKSRAPSDVEVERLVRGVKTRLDAPRFQLNAWRSRLRTALSFAVAVACGGLAWAGFGHVLNVLVGPEPAPRATEPVVPPAPPPAAKRRALPRVVPPAEPTPAPEVVPSSEAAVPAPVAPKPAASVARGTSSAVVSAQSADDLITLADARRVLGNDPGRALALTEASERMSPRSQFGEERSAIAIEALERLGRLGEAEQRLGSFEQRFPNSPYRRRLRAGLEPHETQP